jgi:hypothetical protein
MDFYKNMMIDRGLYLVGMSEVRRDGSGEEDVGDGFTFVWQGRVEGGSRGGVAFLLSPAASKAWREAKSRSVSVTSGRILAVTLQLGGNEGTWNIITVYGPTSQSSDSEKERFWDELQETYDSYPSDTMTVIIGDFNSRVGSRSAQDCDELREVLGPYGLGPRNANGDALLQFCIQNQLRVEHTFHKHKVSQKATWYHPRFRNPGVIDMALVQRSRAKFAADVCVLPSVESLSDHQLCRLKLVQKPDIPWSHRQKSAAPGRPRRLPVDLVGEDFAKAVDEALKDIHDMEEAQRRLRKVAEDTLPKTEAARPQWQKENAERLKQLSRERQRAFEERQQQNSDETRRAYRDVCRQNRRATRRMVARWWDERLSDMEKAAEHGNAKALHEGVARLLDFITNDGGSKRALSKDHEAEQEGMTRHFETVLNVTRTVNPNVVDSAKDFSHIGKAMDWSEPTTDDVRWAVRQLNSGKAADSIGLQAELFKCCIAHEGPEQTCELTRILTETVQSLWRGEDVPESWLDSILIPLYKRKGARLDWNNWRGIVLLNIASKIHTILINRSLRKLAEKLVPETQVGFRSERGSADGQLVLRRIFECFRTMSEKNADPAKDLGVYTMFVDLKKAFDSVDRDTLFTLLEKKCGVPANVVRAIRNLHNGMQARTLHRGKLSEPFEMKTGVRQGSIEGPTLWNIFYCFVLLDWQDRCGGGGVTFEYTLDGALRTGARNAQSAAHQTTIRDVEYADDLAFFETDWERFCEAARLLDETCADWGAEISQPKTKWMYITTDLGDHPKPDLHIRGEVIERVHTFVYLGSVLGDSYSLGVSEDIERRIAEASKTFGRLKPIWKSKNLARSIKQRLFIVCVSTTLLYGCENWVLTQAHKRAIDKFWYGKIRSILGITWRRMRDQRITNEACARMLGVSDWKVLAGSRHTRWLGHIARTPPARLARQTLFGFVKDRVQQRTGKRGNLVSQAKSILQGLPEMDSRIWAHTAQNKEAWNALCTKWNVNAPEFIPANDKQCPLCNAIFKNVAGVSRHISTKHPLNTERHPCSYPGCQETFKTTNARSRHLATVHGIGPPRPFACTRVGCSCGPFVTNAALQAHLRRSHNG